MNSSEKFGERGLLPQVFRRLLGYPQLDPRTVNDAVDELEIMALGDRDQCSGYFPNSEYADNVGMDASERFAKKYQTIQSGNFGPTYTFSWLRCSLVPQKPMYGMHIDSNAQTGIGIPEAGRRSWRVLFNLGREVRRLTYSIQPVGELTFTDRGGLQTCESYDEGALRTFPILPYDGYRVHGVVFCASHVLHSGDDGDGGHMLASYGLEDVA